MRQSKCDMCEHCFEFNQVFIDDDGLEVIGICSNENNKDVYREPCYIGDWQYGESCKTFKSNLFKRHVEQKERNNG
jgi:hypothetical protein